ncbi:MAG: hypothetical protein COU40_01315 [Candidatus Moranbacteria bacterium CG10_big_fil_rev_8_21_14_0_10_35_21]|nr:MAG: hypothetical protein COU40_01315 [Candidatus Moranbacteria bacterium CG10_big_fil_rev_8_21_14_0_10_35_21]PJA88387.1 MAG: hypothetical protein CO139_03340 [Candidatus Moranbacteria bacterium CG_4_9_14_3_um_filter_36_9]
MKIKKKISLILVVFLIGGLGGVFFDRVVFPYLNSSNWFSRYEFLRKSSDEVTVINKTEQVFVKEETSINKIASRASSSVVNILSYSENALKENLKNGTGVIATSDGIIITYSTAINLDNSKYKIFLSDGASYDAQLIGIDSFSGLVFLRIQAQNLPVISFGNSDDTKPGEKIVAIGNNTSYFSNRFASGLLSAIRFDYSLSGKSVSLAEKLEGVFGSDFANQKNYVGGPIVDYTGQVIGITGSLEKNNQIEYFQIPSNKIRGVLDRMIKNELDKAPTLGIYYIPLTPQYAMSHNMAGKNGALIYSPSGQQGLAIIAGSPAQKAGLQIKDIITKIGNQEINLNNPLPDLLIKYKKGEIAEITIQRAEKEMVLKVQL